MGCPAFLWCARHDTMTWRCKSSGGLDDGNPKPNGNGYRCEAGSKGSRRQSFDLTNSNRV